jgi:hypothetical protein
MLKMSIPSSCEKRWQCVSGAVDLGSVAAEEARGLLESTLKVCRLLPVGMTAEAAARTLRLEAALPAPARWTLTSAR